MSKRFKLAILGGSALATPILFEVMGQRHAQASYDVVLHGRDPERLELVQRVSQAVIASSPGLDVKVSASSNFQEALEGADYCINQIRVGGLEGRAFDETFPRQFGIPGEETVGPGGFNNALRGISTVLEMCHIIEKVAPQALLFNLTNPSSIVQSAIRRYSNVNVIGTCDSPVSLMEMIAKLLGLPVNELRFDMSGIHHFGWVAGVHHQGINYLDEVLRRVVEMPKVGVDAELLQAIGVIPVSYLRYYFHPDRVLAETEGRAIRAHQLMALSAQMLADFRAWKPGMPPNMLAKRGAVWYQKIVAPALLAFAEKQTTELVLSVDNAGKLPWLPDRAIVEVPVQITDGVIQGERTACLPQSVQAMMAQNCAYEMLAAEAIVETDRKKALQALMANLLVTSYNQARGILNLIWSGETRVQFNTVSIAPQKKTDLGFKVPTLFYGNRLLENYGDPQAEDYALITMEELWGPVKDRLKRLPSMVLFVRELDWYRLEAMEKALPDVTTVVGLGGGVAQDAAKYIGWRRHIPVDEIVSITSVDASVTKSIAARAGGHVTYIGYIVPRYVYVDYPLIQSAPKRLNRSGVGDILCAHTALWDWKFSQDQTGEDYDPDAVVKMHAWLKKIRDSAQHINQVTEQGIQVVMQAFEDISIICRKFGSSRPQEASDHTFAYNAEFQTGKNFLHGELVGLGAWVMANLQGNDPDFLSDVYQHIGILWQPREIGLTREEFIQTLKTLNWYQSNFGRRFSVLNKKSIDQKFISQVCAQLTF